MIKKGFKYLNNLNYILFNKKIIGELFVKNIHYF